MPWLQGWPGGAWRTLADEAPRRAQPRDDEWWRHFNDPVLDQLVAEAQRLNPGVRTAGLRIMEARAQLGIAGSGLYPQLQQVTAEALRVRQPRQRRPAAPTFGSGRPGFRPGLGAGLLGQVQARHRVGRCRLLRQHRAVRRRAGAGRGAGGEPVRDRSAPPSCGCASRNENAAIQQRSLEITERLFRSGNESELDVQQARSQYLGTLATIPEIESSLRQTHNALCVLLARPPDALPELQRGRAKIPEARLEVIVDMPAELLRRRPDVRAAEMQLAAQSAQIGVSEAALYPSIALAGSVGLSATSIGSPSTTLGWALGPALVWNVFDHGRLTNQVLVQDARFQQLYEQYQDAVLRAARELDDAASGFAYSRAQVDILRDAVQAARRSLDIATVQYREGLGRLPARARFAASAVQRAGTPGRQPGRRGSVPDRGLQGDGRRLAGRPLAAGARRRHASHDGRAQQLEGAAAGPLAAALGRVPASRHERHAMSQDPAIPPDAPATEPGPPPPRTARAAPRPPAAAPASAPWSSPC